MKALFRPFSSARFEHVLTRYMSIDERGMCARGIESGGFRLKETGFPGRPDTLSRVRVGPSGSRTRGPHMIWAADESALESLYMACQ